MTIRAMTLDELRMVLGWAADEGWNPGLHDAEAFFAAEPSGFLIKLVEDEPVAAISVLTDECDPDNLAPVNVSEIIQIASEAEPHMIALFRNLIAEL